MNWEEILQRFISPESKLWHIVTTHSRAVADLALAIVDAHPELHADREFVFQAAMIHDVGVVWTNAPDIECHGSLPYICHGYAGYEALEALGLHDLALVCLRHTGSGMTKDYVVANNLPLPPMDYLPVSIEEKIVCYADKFFSKSRDLTEQKSFERALRSVSKYGDESRERFEEMDRLFRIPSII